jgi:hypothetical protein
MGERYLPITLTVGQILAAGWVITGSLLTPKMEYELNKGSTAANRQHTNLYMFKTIRNQVLNKDMSQLRAIKLLIPLLQTQMLIKAIISQEARNAI